MRAVSTPTRWASRVRPRSREVRADHPDLEPGTATGDKVGVTGRVMLARNTGKLCFATIRDGSGDLQIMLSLAKVGEEALEAWKRDVDLGDHVGVEGEVITSRRGELSIMADRFAITSKCLRPLPEKHAGLTDPEARVRQRYVDLIVNDEARRMARLRSDTVRAIRDFWHDEGYLEVETPMLQPIHGGAAARPFKTHINAYDMDLYLRIAIELYLKRLVVGGIEKVFEISRNFRNEGADSTHNPEFTMLEAYEAYGDYDDDGRPDPARSTRPRSWPPSARRSWTHDGQEIDLGGAEWPQITLYGAVSDAVGEELTTATPLEQVRKLRDQRESLGTTRRGGRAGSSRSCSRRSSSTRSSSRRSSGLPAGDLPARPPAPRQPAAHREVGPDRLRHRAGHRLLRADRPDRAAPPPDRAVPARGRRRPRGDAARRGLPARAGVRHAARPAGWASASTA